MKTEQFLTIHLISGIRINPMNSYEMFSYLSITSITTTFLFNSPRGAAKFSDVSNYVLKRQFVILQVF